MIENDINKMEEPLSKINKIYVINLARSPERWIRVSENLNKLGIDYERFEAVDGYNILIKNIDTGEEFRGLDIKQATASLSLNNQYQIICNPEDENPSSFIFEYNKPPVFNSVFSPGLFGVYCSNRLIAEEIVRKKYNYTIVMEDDIIIENFDFKKKLELYLVNLPKSFDIAYVGVLSDNKNLIEVNPYVYKFAPDNGFFTRMALIESYKGAEKFLINPIFRDSLDNFILDSSRSKIHNTDQSILDVYVAFDELRDLVHLVDAQSDINDMIPK